MRWFSPARLAPAGLFVLGAAAFVLWLAPANGYDLLLVDPAHPVDSVIRVPGEKPGGKPGPIYFVDVRERPARLLERLIPWTRADGSDLVPAPPISPTLERRLGQLDMPDSQKIASVVALSHRERAEARSIVREVRYVELSGRADFNDLFVDELAFPG